MTKNYCILTLKNTLPFSFKVLGANFSAHYLHSTYSVCNVKLGRKMTSKYDILQSLTPN